MLGLAAALPPAVRTTFVSFAEGGRCEAFLAEVRRRGFGAQALRHDTPHLLAATTELVECLRGLEADFLLCHGYKSILLGRIAARRLGVPAAAVSRGWTGESRKVRIYEWLERRTLRFMDHVVCVSEGQADKVRRWCGLTAGRLSTIHNSAREVQADRTSELRERLVGLFPRRNTPRTDRRRRGPAEPGKGFSRPARSRGRFLPVRCGRRRGPFRRRRRTGIAGTAAVGTRPRNALPHARLS